MRNYTDDIRRYRSGKMTPEERHALEREALNDPFLAEALEGAEEIDATAFAEEVAALNRRVEHRAQRQPGKRWQQLVRVAAAVVVLALATFGIVYLWPGSKPEPIALEQVTTREAETLAAGSDSPQVAFNEKVLQHAGEQKQKDERQPVTDPVVSDKKTDQKLTLAEKPQTKENVQGVLQEETELAASENEAARALKPAVNTPVMALRSEPDREAEGGQISKVVIAGEQKNVPGFKAAYPEGGLEAYLNYLEQSRQYPSEALKQKTEGLAVIEFVVEPDGSLSNLKVVRSLGSGCDEELIRLVRKGTRWLPAMQYNTPVHDTVRVQLRFKLPK